MKRTKIWPNNWLFCCYSQKNRLTNLRISWLYVPTLAYEKRIYLGRFLNPATVMWVEDLLVSLFKKLAWSMPRQLQMGQQETDEKVMKMDIYIVLYFCFIDFFGMKYFWPYLLYLSFVLWRKIWIQTSMDVRFNPNPRSP